MYKISYDSGPCYNPLCCKNHQERFIKCPKERKASQIKHLQAHIHSKTKEKISVTQAKMSIEITRLEKDWPTITRLSIQLSRRTENEKLPMIVTPQQIYSSSFLTVTLLKTLYFKQICTPIKRIDEFHLYWERTFTVFLTSIWLRPIASYLLGLTIGAMTLVWVFFSSTVMTRERFGQILSNLHVNDNTAVPDGN